MRFVQSSFTVTSATWCSGSLFGGMCNTLFARRSQRWSLTRKKGRSDGAAEEVNGGGRVDKRVAHAAGDHKFNFVQTVRQSPDEL